MNNESGLMVDLNDERQFRAELKVDDYGNERVGMREWIKFPGMEDWRPGRQYMFPLKDEFHDKIMPLLLELDKTLY